MKKIIIIALTIFATVVTKAQDIQLPAVNMQEKTSSMLETLATRHSVREYSNEPLTLQQISNLCWAATGVSRDEQHRTSPTAMNKKEIRLFVFNTEGAYEYLPVENKLQFIAKGDNRQIVAGAKGGFSQDFVMQAPISLVMVIDFDKFGSNNEHSKQMACVDAGIMSQNINLYCQSVGLVTVPRATMDADAIRKLLGLTENQLPIMNNPVGLKKQNK